MGGSPGDAGGRRGSSVAEKGPRTPGLRGPGPPLAFQAGAESISLREGARTYFVSRASENRSMLVTRVRASVPALPRAPGAVASPGLPPPADSPAAARGWAALPGSWADVRLQPQGPGRCPLQHLAGYSLPSAARLPPTAGRREAPRRARTPWPHMLTAYPVSDLAGPRVPERRGGSPALGVQGHCPQERPQLRLPYPRFHSERVSLQHLLGEESRGARAAPLVADLGSGNSADFPWPQTKLLDLTGANPSPPKHVV